MQGAWWVGKDDLDDDQQSVIILKPDRSFVILGPPGSGKTNLLLLRANYLYLAGYKNLLIIVFTRSLRDFIAEGAQNYDFPVEKVTTSTAWAHRFLKEHGVQVLTTGDFEEQRHQLLTAVQKLIEGTEMGEVYDAILLDEAQDYLLEEIKVFRGLATRLIMTADKKQRIYAKVNTVNKLTGFVNEVKELEIHYRNGNAICRLADGIGAGWNDYKAMLDTCNYDEASKPSSVEVITCKGIEHEADEILKKLDLQLKAYPDELIGIVTPRNNELNVLWEQIAASPFANLAVLHGGGEHSAFGPDTRICVTNIHGAKGLEFRAMHFAGCEFLTKFSNQRQLTFTAITRCKTSITLYHSGTLPGYLQAALAKLQPLPDLPELSDVFGGKK